MQQLKCYPVTKKIYFNTCTERRIISDYVYPIKTCIEDIGQKEIYIIVYKNKMQEINCTIANAEVIDFHPHRAKTREEIVYQKSKVNVWQKVFTTRKLPQIH